MTEAQATLPETMAAAVLTGHGGLERLEYRTDWPVPRPQAGEILIRVGAAGVNNTDINTRTGWYSKRVTDGTTAEGGTSGFDAASEGASTWSRSGLTFPRIQGADIAGRVAAVGAGVDSGWVGARVMVDPWLRDWDDPLDFDQAGYVGSECDGGFAQYACLPEPQVHRVESPWSDEELASFPCSYSTAENMLTRAGVAESETVLVTGASGGVGSALVQLAGARGARVLAVAGAAKADQVRALGAAEVFERDAPDLAARVRDATGGRGAHVVADVVGGPPFDALLDALAVRGRYVTSGAIAGPVVELDLRTLYLKDLSFFGATVTTPGIFPSLLGHIEHEAIRPLLAASYPLSEIRQAQTDFLAKRHVGKLVLVPPADG